MSKPAYFILYKLGRRVPIKQHPIVICRTEEDNYKLHANASYTDRTGLDHIHRYLKDLIREKEYDFDGIQSSLDGKIFYLNHEGFVANELVCK